MAKHELLIKLDSTSEESAKAPLDADRVTPWSRGYEHVEIQIPAHRSSPRLAIEVAKPLIEPAELWMATREGLHRLRLPPSNEKLYSVDLPIPQDSQDRCVAFVQPYRGISLVEIMGLVETKKVSTTEGLVKELSRPDPGFAPAALTLRGPEAALALTRYYPRMSAMARVRATEVAEALPASLGLSVQVAAIEHGSEREQERALAFLEMQPELAAQAIAVRQPFAESAGKSRLSEALVQLSPDLAVRVIAPQLGKGSAAERLSARKAVAQIATTQPGQKELRLLFNEEIGEKKSKSHLPTSAQVELLRALSPWLVSWGGAAVELLEKRMSTASFEEAYVLLPAAALTANETPSAEKTFATWLRGEAPIGMTELQRYALAHRALELLGEQTDPGVLRRYSSQIQKLTLADNMRVRKSAWLLLAQDPTTVDLQRLSSVLVKESWPQVRVAAAEVVLKYPSSTEEGQKLARLLADRLLRDKEALARRAFARALAHHGSDKTLKSLRKSLRTDPYYEVRTEAALALGKLCDKESIPVLTDLSLVLAQPSAGEGQVLLGLGALTALAQLDPADLKKRIAPLQSSRVSGVLRNQVELRLDGSRLERTSSTCSL